VKTASSEYTTGVAVRVPCKYTASWRSLVYDIRGKGSFFSSTYPFTQNNLQPTRIIFRRHQSVENAETQRKKKPVGIGIESHHGRIYGVSNTTLDGTVSVFVHKNDLVGAACRAYL